MTMSETDLHTLTYRVDAAQLGELVLYPLTSAFSSAWDRFEARVKRHQSKHEFSPRYSNLATALTAVTGQPVGLFPTNALSPSQKAQTLGALLVTTAPIDPWLLTTAVRAFERLSVLDDQADTLAPHLDGIKPDFEALSEHVAYEDGRVQAPGWLFKVAQWNLVAKIAQEPILVDGHLPIRLRPDTEGTSLHGTTRSPGRGARFHVTP